MAKRPQEIMASYLEVVCNFLKKVYELWIPQQYTGTVPARDFLECGNEARLSVDRVKGDRRGSPPEGKASS